MTDEPADGAPRPALHVVAPGTLALVEDLGREGWYSSGVGVGGAADPVSLRLANRLVGNEEHAAAVEALMGGLQVRAVGGLVVAVTGAPAALTVDGRPATHGLAVEVGDGALLALAPPEAGMRSYLAVRGGLAVDPVLGSRSRDTLAGLGPQPLAVGDVLPVGEPGARTWSPTPAPGAAATTRPPDDVVRVHVVLGPRDDWFAEPRHLLAGTWTASSQADRVGVRLDRAEGEAPLHRCAAMVDAELPTEGVALGAVQVPPSGQPVVFLADHPITGGYPVVATVITQDVPLLAQIRQGQRVAFELAETAPSRAAATPRPLRRPARGRRSDRHRESA